MLLKWTCAASVALWDTRDGNETRCCFFFCFAFSRHFRATELRKIVFLAKIVRSRSVKLIRQYIFIYGNAAH